MKTHIGLSSAVQIWVSIMGSKLYVLNCLIYVNLSFYRAAAVVAMGSHEPRKLMKTGSRDHANRVFVEAYMTGSLTEVYTE